MKRFNEFPASGILVIKLTLPFGVYTTLLCIVMLKEIVFVLFLIIRLIYICKFCILNVDTGCLKNKKKYRIQFYE